MVRIRRPCLEAGCPELAFIGGSRCERHHAENEKARRALYRPLGRPWRRTRDKVLKQEPTCRQCGKPSEEADHVQPRARGGSDDRANLQGLCFACNRAKGAS